MRLQLKRRTFLTRRLPALVWLLALGAVVFLFYQHSATELGAVVFSYEQPIHSVETGCIRSIPVTLYQNVKKGDTLAVIGVQDKQMDAAQHPDVIVLAAPFDGIVNTLTYKPGQTVVPGDPIMTIVKPKSEVATAWVGSQGNQKR